MTEETFFVMLRNEALRVEIGAGAVSELAVENIGLSTRELSRAVRRSVIVRRAGGTGLSANRLRMEEVGLPETLVPTREPRAA